VPESTSWEEVYRVQTARIAELEAENENLLTQRLGSVQYMGNGIQHWYSKATAYKKVICDIWDILKIRPYILKSSDGKTSVVTRVAELMQRAEAAESRLADIAGLPEKWRGAEPYYGVGGRVEQNRCADELQTILNKEQGDE